MRMTRFAFVVSGYMLATVMLGASPAAAQAERRPSRPPATDQTVPVQKGQRLQVQNFAGEVLVKAWNKDELRVVADHDSRAKVDVRTAGVEIERVRLPLRRPGIRWTDTISVPAWLPVRVSGTYNFVSIEGTQSDVSVDTTRGDVTLKGGSGVVSLKSIEGEIIVDDARGKLKLETVNEGISIRGATGDITATTINGDIRMLGMKAASLEATTVNGDIIYEGAVADGFYRCSTHNGDITLALPENPSAERVGDARIRGTWIRRSRSPETRATVAAAADADSPSAMAPRRSRWSRSAATCGSARSARSRSSRSARPRTMATTPTVTFPCWRKSLTSAQPPFLFPEQKKNPRNPRNPWLVLIREIRGYWMGLIVAVTTNGSTGAAPVVFCQTALILFVANARCPVAPTTRGIAEA